MGTVSASLWSRAAQWVHETGRKSECGNGMNEDTTRRLGHRGRQGPVQVGAHWPWLLYIYMFYMYTIATFV